MNRNKKIKELLEKAIAVGKVSADNEDYLVSFQLSIKDCKYLLSLLDEGGAEWQAFPQAEQEANAHLLAAAPELYESCRILTELLSYWLPRIKERCGGEDVTYRAELKKARAALTKAKHPKIKSGKRRLKAR